MADVPHCPLCGVSVDRPHRDMCPSALSGQRVFTAGQAAAWEQAAARQAEPHPEHCSCCDYVDSLRLVPNLALINDKLDSLYRRWLDLTGKVDRIMAAQDDVNAATAALQQLIDEAQAIVAALQAGAAPVDTSALVTATSGAQAALASIQAALPAQPAPAPPAAAQAGQEAGTAADTGGSPTVAPPVSPF